MNIRRSIALLLIAAGVLAHGAEKKPLDRSESMQLTAAVESVDKATRTIVLKGEEGARVLFVAGPEVRNFDQIKAGDKVRVTYLIAVGAQVKPRGTPPSAPIEAATGKRSEPGQPPGVAAGRTVISTVKIDSVDTSFNTVTFTRADGITRVVAIEDPEARRFVRSLKPGDSVEVTYSEATAVSVEPAAPH
jgi:hypothetical protein